MIWRLMSRIVFGRATLAFLRSIRRIFVDSAKKKLSRPPFMD
jgi:hypothetical protein